MSLNGSDPLIAAFGSEGANTLTGKTGSESEQWNTKGSVVSVYRRFPGGGGANSPIPQLTASGVTFVGGAENVPLAVNCTCSPFVVWLIAMDCS